MRHARLEGRNLRERSRLNSASYASVLLGAASRGQVVRLEARATGVCARVPAST